jgi:hypothetical protein
MLPVPEGPEEEFWVLSEAADIDHLAMMKVQSIFDISSVAIMLAIEEMSYVVVVYRNQLGEFYVF